MLRLPVDNGERFFIDTHKGASMTTTTASNMLTAVEAAEYLGVQRQTLAVWRSANRYNLPYVKVGHAIRYRKSDLDDWLESNASLAWTVDPKPWEMEDELLSEVSLPLNIKGNTGHPFHGYLKSARKRARDRARRLPVADETGLAR